MDMRNKPEGPGNSQEVQTQAPWTHWNSNQGPAKQHCLLSVTKLLSFANRHVSCGTLASFEFC